MVCGQRGGEYEQAVGRIYVRRRLDEFLGDVTRRSGSHLFKGVSLAADRDGVTGFWAGSGPILVRKKAKAIIQGEGGAKPPSSPLPFCLCRMGWKEASLNLPTILSMSSNYRSYLLGLTFRAIERRNGLGSWAD